MSSMILDGAAPRSRSTDPVTSVDAGRAANLSKSQAAVLERMTNCMSPASGWTHEELESDLRFYWSPSRIRSAVSELEELGLVEWTGKTRKTRYGRQARVYRAVSDA